MPLHLFFFLVNLVDDLVIGGNGGLVLVDPALVEDIVEEKDVVFIGLPVQGLLEFFAISLVDL